MSSAREARDFNDPGLFSWPENWVQPGTAMLPR